MSLFKDHFSRQAVQYASYRPAYPLSLVEELASLCAGRQLALDCACGTGQLSVPLAQLFERVQATDASSAQIDNAEPHPRVHYRVALAEESGLPDETVDLVTVAQAAHWLNLEAFYGEVLRVSRPGGLLALVSYGILQVEGPVNALVQHFYRHTLESYWPPERKDVENGYLHLPFPFEEVPFAPRAMEMWWRREELLGYLSTWSAVQAALLSPQRDAVVDFGHQVLKLWPDGDNPVRVTWPLLVRAGRVR